MRVAIRDKEIVLPRRLPVVEEFARHMAADAKVLDEDEETGAKTYRYVKAGGENHYSMAFTYALMAWMRGRLYSCPVVFLWAGAGVPAQPDCRVPPLQVQH
jgi:hypothetical protein